ncbi:MAG: hypothetical protein KDD66_06140 [Bdellovibrionales bacterium]|nr:hypothetical protein [Bdellovibrionales bacterium]
MWRGGSSARVINWAKEDVAPGSSSEFEMSAGEGISHGGRAPERSGILGAIAAGPVTFL